MATWLSTDEPLFCLVSAGHKVYDRPLEEFHDCNRRLPPLRAVLQLTLSGAGFHRRGGRRSLITPGMAFLDILPGDWSYGGAVESRGAYEQVFLAFNGESAFSLTQQLTARFGHGLEFGRNSALVAPMMVLARQFERHQPGDRAGGRCGVRGVRGPAPRMAFTTPATRFEYSAVHSGVSDP